MSSTTRSKLKFLRKYVAENFNEWRERYSDSVVGVHVGHKRVAGERQRAYSIVFHVVKKKDVKPAHTIPGHFRIRIPALKRMVRVPTDVIQTGLFKHKSLRAGDRIDARKERGTVSFFAWKGDDLYACSNAHVIARRFMDRRHVRIPLNEQKKDTLITGPNGRIYAMLEESVYDGIDAAIAYLPPATRIDTFVDRIGRLGRPTNLPNASTVGLEVRLFGARTGYHEGRVRRVGVVKHTGVPGITLNDLVELELDVLTEHGDSGAPIVTVNNRFLAILVGGDDNYDYGIPVAAICERLDLEPITET